MKLKRHIKTTVLMGVILTHLASPGCASKMEAISVLDTGIETTRDGTIHGWLDDQHLVFTSRPIGKLPADGTSPSSLLHTYVLNTSTNQIEKSYSGLRVECLNEKGEAIWYKDGRPFRGNLLNPEIAEPIDLHSRRPGESKTLFKTPTCNFINTDEITRFGPLPSSKESKTSYRFKLFENDGYVVVDNENTPGSAALVTSYDVSGNKVDSVRIRTGIAPFIAPKYIAHRKMYFVHAGGYTELGENARKDFGSYLVGWWRLSNGTFEEITIPLLSASTGLSPTYQSSNFRPIPTPIGIEISADAQEWIAYPNGEVRVVLKALVFAKESAPNGTAIAILGVAGRNDGSNPKLKLIKLDPDRQ
jgi:hypothetical protein